MHTRPLLDTRDLMDPVPINGLALARETLRLQTEAYHREIRAITARQSREQNMHSMRDALNERGMYTSEQVNAEACRELDAEGKALVEKATRCYGAAEATCLKAAGERFAALDRAKQIERARKAGERIRRIWSQNT